MKRTIITILIVAGIAVLIGWVLSKNKKENEEKTAFIAEGSGAVFVNVQKVSKQPLNLDFSSNGNFAAWQDLQLLAENSGRITRILVSEGSRVSRGQVLAHIDAEYLNLELESAEDALAKIKTDQGRYKSSYETGGVTQSQVDEIDLNLRNAENRVQQAKRRLQDAYVKAPINGIINKRNIEVGTYVSPGTELFDIVDVSKLKLLVNANEYQVISLQNGTPAKITSNVFPDKEFNGKVTFIAAKADNSLNYPVEILVENEGSQQLKAGMYGTAYFEFPETQPTVVIPRTAFVGSVSSNQVYVLQNGNRAKVTSVTPGRILGEQVEILSGLTENDTVIISGQVNLVDGTEVNPQNTAAGDTAKTDSVQRDEPKGE